MVNSCLDMLLFPVLVFFEEVYNFKDVFQLLLHLCYVWIRGCLLGDRCWCLNHRGEVVSPSSSTNFHRP